MKKQILLLLTAVFVSMSSLFSQQLTNNGFETWTQPSNPDGWSTFASGVAGTPYAAAATFLSPAAIRDVGAVGAYSTKLSTIDVSATLGAYGINTVPGAVGLGALNPNALTTGSFPFLGTAFPYRPDTLFFAYSYAPAQVDSTAKLELVFLRQGVPVAQGYIYSLTAGAWGLGYIAINDWVDACPADTIILNFMASGMNSANVGSVLHVDTLFFKYSTPLPTPTVSISVSQSTAPESVGTITYTATLSAPNPCGAISVPATFSGTANGSGVDYSASGTSFDFGIGATTATITVTVVDDAALEGDETITATLGAATGVTLGTPVSATVTITDNDLPAPTVTLSTSTATLAEPSGTATLTATLSSPATTTISVPVTFSGTAANPADYTVSGNSFDFAIGELTKDITVTITDDAVQEPAEDLIVTLGTPTGATLGSPSSVSITIDDDDFIPGAPDITLAASPASIAENGGTATITATLSVAAATDITADLTLSGTASGGVDYSVAPTSFTILAGQLSAAITVTAIDDAVIEANETVIGTLSNVVGANIATPSSATVTIIDDDVPPTLSISVLPASIAENGGSSTITATLSSVSAVNVTANITLSGTATQGVDYVVGGSLSITIPAGQLSTSVTVIAVDDAIQEGSENIVATLSNVSSGATLGSPSSATVVIMDDDATISISAYPLNLAENSGTAAFILTLSAAYSTDINVQLAFSGTAAYGVDYSTTTGTTVTIPAGQLSATIGIFPLDDALPEGNETLIADIASVTGGSVVIGTPSSATITIIDDDAVPQLSVSVAPSSISETSGSAEFTFTLTSFATSDVTATVTYTGSAVNGTDYTATGGTTITIPQGDLFTTINLYALDDAIVEGNENVTVTLSNVSAGATLGSPSSAVVTIIDNDVPSPNPSVFITVSNSSVNEASGPITLTVSLTDPAVNNVVVGVNFSGSAVIPDDYTVDTTFFTIPQGQISATGIITLVDDPYYEGTETIFITVNSLSGAILGQPATASIVITDNENPSDPPPPPPVLPSGITAVDVFSTLNVYPVPARDYVNVSMEANETQIATLVDMQGRVVKETMIVSGVNTINLSDVNSGTYVLRFTNNEYRYFTGAKPVLIVK